MLGTALLCSALLTTDAPASPSPEDLAAYRAAQATVGRDAEAHVRLALWCEARGLTAERRKHLAMATLIDPGHPTARGLLGQVPDDGRWRKPDEIADQVKNDPALSAKLAEYDRKRSQAKDTAAEQWDLATWCEQQGLKAQARAHFLAVARLDPKRDAAWKRLGYTKARDGRWLTDQQVAAEAAEREARQTADRHWRPLLARWKGGLSASGRRDRAEASLWTVTDPRSVPSIWKVFGRGKAEDQLRAVQLLGQVDAIPASRMLTLLAVSGRSDEVRRSAAETLRRRDPREFADVLINLLRDPIKYEVRPIGGPGSPGELLVEGKRLNLKRLYSPPPAPELPLLPTDLVTYDADGLPVVVRPIGTSREYDTLESYLAQRTGMWGQGDRAASFLAERGFGVSGRQSGNAATGSMGPLTDIGGGEIKPNARPRTMGFSGFTVSTESRHYARIPIGQMAVESQRAAAAAQQQLENDTRAIEAYNEPILKTNARVGQLLRDATGEDLGDDRKAWQAWLTSQLGLSASQSTSGKMTLTENVTLAYQPQSIPVSTFVGESQSRITHSCFAAGTLVRTKEGTRPIETLKAGDLVLAQDTSDGSLDYKPVVAVHHNPPSPTFRISLGGEEVVSSTFHRFWKTGQGWTMARDLKVGDTLRTLSGLETVTAIDPEKVQPVFNLSVADSHSFFVGREGALVHDNSLPGLRYEPFDAPMALAAEQGGRDE
jgi:hypothetical protein